MKSSKLILAIWLAANAWAQNLPQKQQVSPPAAAKPNAAPASKQAAPLKPKAMPPKVQTNQPPAKAAAQPSRKPATPVRAATGSGGRTQAAPTSAQRRVNQRKQGRHSAVGMTAAKDTKPKPKAGRDPFVSPVVERKIASASCSGTGRQCLVVGDITLQGVVRSPSGYIAVVVNGDHTYFLHVNDPLADGAVEKITRDAITLQQHSSDALGRPQVREVTKRLGVPAG